MTNRHDLTDEELRALLQRGDPAADGSEPTANELAGMRHTILQQANRQETPVLGLSWATMAAAASVVVALLVVALFVAIGPTGGGFSQEGGQPGTEAGPTSEAPAVAPSAGTATTEPTAEPQQLTEPGRAAGEPQTTLPQPTAPRKPRTVQFMAPRGTRIIWTLDPNFKFPITEPQREARGELSE